MGLPSADCEELIWLKLQCSAVPPPCNSALKGLQRLAWSPAITHVVAPPVSLDLLGWEITPKDWRMAEESAFYKEKHAVEGGEWHGNVFFCPFGFVMMLDRKGSSFFFFFFEGYGEKQTDV